MKQGFNLQDSIKPPKSSFFLFGCRGTGKSTWVKKTFPKATVVSLLDEARYQRYLAAPDLFRQELNVLDPGEWVFVDEIQRQPNLLNEVHAAIEERGLKCQICQFGKPFCERETEVCPEFSAMSALITGLAAVLPDSHGSAGRRPVGVPGRG